jgi:glycosyltransferase involved in cell wall biosynthesis
MNKPKGSLRILHIVLSIGETSAPYNEHCLPWADKHDITICTFFGSDIDPAKTITYFEGDGSLKGFIRTLNSALVGKDYDIIHAHSPHVGLLFLVVMLFSYQKSARSTVVTVHDSYQNYKLRNRIMFLPVFASFKRVVCCSRASFDSFPTLYKRLAGDRLCVVQNGLDIDRVDRIAAITGLPNRQTSNFRIKAISRLVGIKNPTSLLTAFQQSADQTSRLTYIGDGPLRAALVEQSRKAGFGHQIEFTGLIPREDVFNHLFNADLFISTSRGEGLPISVLEAMTCRCPVLLSDIPPHREIAETVDFIPLIQPDDIAGFAQEIKRFREMSELDRAKLGEKCRTLVEKRFSLSAMHAGYAEVYAEILHDNASSILDAARSVNVS